MKFVRESKKQLKEEEEEEKRDGSFSLLRLHSADSTFDSRELNLKDHRSDSFTHLFWKMSTRSRPMHDSGATQQVRAYTGYQKLRAAIAAPIDDSSSEKCRMIYFKADNDRGRLIASMQQDVDGVLRGSSLTEEQLLTNLIVYFPTFTRESLELAVTSVKVPK